jgi:hypothetical protein
MRGQGGTALPWQKGVASADVLDKPPRRSSHKSANSSGTPQFLGVHMSVVLLRIR